MSAQKFGFPNRICALEYKPDGQCRNAPIDMLCHCSMMLNVIGIVVAKYKFQSASSVTGTCLLWNTGSGLTGCMYFSMCPVVVDNVFQGASSLVAARVK